MASAAPVPQRGKGLLQMLAIAISLVIMTLAAWAILQGGGRITFIIPAGYRGRIKLLLDEEGQELKPDKGVLVVRISRDGTLHVRSFKPFERWHQEEAFYDDGTPIPTGQEASSNDLAFRALPRFSHRQMGNASVEVMLFYVGTQTDADHYMRRVVNTNAPDPF
jgi:hypothetical protein